MTAYIALLKAINVGGTGKMPMGDLVKLCTEAGFEKVKTYIASGNVVFTCPDEAKTVKSTLERKVETYFGKPVPVMIRTAAEMEDVLAANPFSKAPGNRVIVSFLDTPPAKDLMAGARHQTNEEVAASAREIYVHYPDGQGHSKFVLPTAKDGTGRNINTVTKLIELARAL